MADPKIPIDEFIENWAYIEDKLRRARDREAIGSEDRKIFERQLTSVASMLDQLTAERDRRKRPARSVPRRPVRFLAIEAV